MGVGVFSFAGAVAGAVADAVADAVAGTVAGAVVSPTLPCSGPVPPTLTGVGEAVEEVQWVKLIISQGWAGHTLTH